MTFDRLQYEKTHLTMERFFLFLKDFELTKHTKNIKKRYPRLQEASDMQIKNDIVRFQKKEELPSKSMKNNYVLELCSQESLSLSQINSIGHDFRFGI